MPVLVNWFDKEHTITLYRIEGRWTIDDLVKHLAAHVAMGEQQPIFYIVDMSQSNMFPNGILARQNEYTRLFKLDKGLTVLVNAPRFAMIAAPILTRLGIRSHEILFVDSINQATEIIEEYRQRNAEPSREL